MFKLNNKTLTILILILLLGAVFRFSFVSTPNVRGDEGPAIFLRDGPVSKW
jgi:hypothetical protein